LATLSDTISQHLTTTSQHGSKMHLRRKYQKLHPFVASFTVSKNVQIDFFLGFFDDDDVILFSSKLSTVVTHF
jgi:hypothetical protein